MKQKLLPVFATCVLLMLTLCEVNAQSKEVQKEDNARTEESTTTDKNSRRKRKKKKSTSSESNIVKIAPLGFFSGTFPIIYERKVNDLFSVQGSLGITGRNHWREVTNDEGFGTTQSTDKFTYPWDGVASGFDKSDPIYEFKNRKATLGFMASVQPRIYLLNEGLNGMFVGISYSYYKYNFEIPSATYNPSSYEYVYNGSAQKEYEKITDFMVHFGYQTLLKRISLEYDIQMGIRNVKGSKYAFTSYSDGSTTTFIDGLATYKQNRVNINVGFKLGYHF